MEHRKFGSTDLHVSEAGFGAWGIGGGVKVGDVAIGWGETDDNASLEALKKAFDIGINFYDTADFYGLGRSEELIGKAFGNSDKVIIATKAGHRVGDDRGIMLDYSRDHMFNAVEKSLKRLKREAIDLFQFHSAKVPHLKQGECIEAAERLKEQGKIRYWGISLATFDPYPEYQFLKDTGLCSSYQIVFNIINQRALDLIEDAGKNGSGIIARMVLQFGLLTGTMKPGRRFEQTDHRSFRVNDELIKKVNESLREVWDAAAQEGLTPLDLAVSFPLWQPGVSTVIPGIKTAKQAVENAGAVHPVNRLLDTMIKELYKSDLYKVTEIMQALG